MQLKDGNDILNIKRDDQAGFRLDTLATHSKHATICTSEEAPLTTKSDYVNKYPSSLQTTSYHFLSTGTTAEIFAGIVKTTPLHSKNPAQHFHDLNEIETYPDVQSAFFNCLTGERKTKICVRERAPLIRKSNFGGRATILIKHLKFSFLQHETMDQVTKTEWSSKMDVLRSPILIYSYHLP